MLLHEQSKLLAVTGWAVNIMLKGVYDTYFATERSL
jgi:hypothetical protein